MDVKEQIRLLVQEAVQAYLEEKKEEKTKPAILILLGYQTSHPLDVLEAVTSISCQFDITILLTKEWLSAKEHLSSYPTVMLEEVERKEWLSLVERAALLVLPIASYQLLAKLALTIDDDPASWFVIQYQLLGKPVVIANNQVELTVYQEILAPNSVQSRVQAYIRQIQADQVKWVPLHHLAKTMEQQLIAYKEKQPLILAKHMEKANREGIKELQLPKASKLTPIAKDLARELHIHLKEQDS